MAKMTTDKDMLIALIEAIDYSFLKTDGSYDKNLTHPVIDKVNWIKKVWRLKHCMKVKITYRCPIGPVESDPTEYTIIENLTTEEYIQKLNNPNDIIKIEVL